MTDPGRHHDIEMRTDFQTNFLDTIIETELPATVYDTPRTTLKESYTVKTY